MGTAPSQPHNNHSASTTFTFHRPGYTSNVTFHLPPDMSCSSCHIHFGLFKRKKVCRDCNKIFCSECTHRFTSTGTSTVTYRQCNKCRVIITGKFTRQDLLKWKVKDLKSVLNDRNISFHGCKEKHDLIDLVFANFAKAHQEDESLSRQPSSLSGSTISSSETPGNPPNNTATNASSFTSPPSHPTMGDNSAPPPAPAAQGPPANESPEEREERLRRRQEEEMRQAMENRLREEGAQNMESPSGARVERMQLRHIRSLEHIDELSVKEMKEVLVNNFVDIKGCVEKEEIRAKLRRLWMEQNRNVQEVESGDGDDNVCKICMDAPVNCVLLECGHILSCVECGKQLSECPICRQYVVRVVRTFKS